MVVLVLNCLGIDLESDGVPWGEGQGSAAEGWGVGVRGSL